MKHTKGTWKEVGAFVVSEIGNRYCTTKIDICSTCNVNNLPLREQIWNARLIAAAPDLLAVSKEALVTVKEILSQYMEHNADGSRGKILLEINLEKAIAKAEKTND